MCRAFLICNADGTAARAKVGYSDVIVKGVILNRAVDDTGYSRDGLGPQVRMLLRSNG